MATIKPYYVSLVKDLIGSYLKFDADSEEAVRLYLQRHYMTKDGQWKLPWCAVYETIPDCDKSPIIIDASKAGAIYLADYQRRQA